MSVWKIPPPERRFIEPGAPAEAYVKAQFPEAFLHGHGPEVTILSKHGEGCTPLSPTFYVNPKLPTDEWNVEAGLAWWWGSKSCLLQSQIHKQRNRTQGVVECRLLKLSPQPQSLNF